MNAERHPFPGLEAGSLEQALAALAASGPVEVLEDGRAVDGLAPFAFEVRAAAGRVMLHLWSRDTADSGRRLARRVLRVAESTPARLELEVQRFGRARPGRLEFVAAARAPAAVRLTRARFRARLEQMLAEQFPDETLDSLTTAADLEHSFSGACARGLLRRGQRVWAVAAVAPAESAATVDAILGTALLWLDWNRRRPLRGTVAGLRVLLPAGASAVTAHRLQALDPATSIELYEMDLPACALTRVDPCDLGNLDTWLTPRREVEETLAAAAADIARVRALAPEAVDAVVPPGTREVSLRFRGLELARWRGGALEPASQAALQRAIARLRKYRNAESAAKNHELYRGQAERWLESMVLAHPEALDARLDPQVLYSQVPAFSAGDRGVIDLLGRTRDARLVVIELKAQEDPNLVLQAVDYWLRVEWHRRQGDFARYGYFAGQPVQDRPAELWLAAPGLRFHPATEVLMRYLRRDIEVTRIGLNENWRAGLQVIFRM